MPHHATHAFRLHRYLKLALLVESRANVSSAWKSGGRSPAFASLRPSAFCPGRGKSSADDHFRPLRPRRHVDRFRPVRQRRRLCRGDAGDVRPAGRGRPPDAAAGGVQPLAPAGGTAGVPVGPAAGAGVQQPRRAPERRPPDRAADRRRGDGRAGVGLVRPAPPPRRRRADVAPTLRTLRDAGVRMGLVSNTFIAGGVHDRHLADAGLLEYLPVRVYSCEFGYPKPNPRIFREALRRLNAPAAETLFVGDLVKVDMAGAARGDEDGTETARGGGGKAGGGGLRDREAFGGGGRRAASSGCFAPGRSRLRKARLRRTACPAAEPLGSVRLCGSHGFRESGETLTRRAGAGWRVGGFASRTR